MNAAWLELRLLGQWNLNRKSALIEGVMEWNVMRAAMKECKSHQQGNWGGGINWMKIDVNLNSGLFQDIRTDNPLITESNAAQSNQQT